MKIKHFLYKNLKKKKAKNVIIIIFIIIEIKHGYQGFTLNFFYLFNFLFIFLTSTKIEKKL